MKDAGTSFAQTHSRNEAAVITQYSGATPATAKVPSTISLSELFPAATKIFPENRRDAFSPSATGTFL